MWWFLRLDVSEFPLKRGLIERHADILIAHDKAFGTLGDIEHHLKKVAGSGIVLRQAKYYLMRRAMPLTNFQETLKQLGSDDVERGKAIGVAERTIRLWRAREPRIIQIIASNPALAQALAKDAELSLGISADAKTAA